MNFLPGTIEVASANAAQVKLSTGETFQVLVDASGAKQGDKVQIGIRPEHLVVNGSDNTVSAPVVFVERIGSTAHVYCSYPGLEEGITCEIDNNLAVENNKALTLSAPPAACHLFADSGKAFRRLHAPAHRKAA
jgi:multiple sugar transport system ATP-binding protein